MTWINPAALSLQIQFLDGGRFVETVNALLSETLSRHGIDRSHLSTNLKITEPDGGIDARCVNLPTTVGRLFPRSNTLFQFKGGDQQRSASVIANEDILENPRVLQALRDGHAFVYLAGWDRGEGFETSVRDSLRTHGLEIEEGQFVFVGRDAIARFLLAFPSICNILLGVEANVIDINTWSQWPSFQNPFQLDARLASQIGDIRARINEQRAIIRVVGAAGDGKTRMVLETLRESSLALSVLYAPQPSLLTPSLISYLSRTPDVRCTIVIDEVDDNEAEDLEQRFSVMPPEVRLVLIGLDASGLAQRRTFQVQGLTTDALIQIIGTIVPGITDENARAIANDCERSPKLAVLIAERIREDPSLLEPRRVIADGIVRRALDRYLTLDPNSTAWQALAATALLMRLGWTDIAEEESVTLFTALGMDPVEARRAVIELHDRFGIAPIAGRFRYVSPAILADFYAGKLLRAWTRGYLASVISSFTQPMIDSFAQRLRRMVSLLENRYIIEDVIFGDQGPFRRLDDLNEIQLSSLLRHLAGPFPNASLQLLRRLILSVTIEELKAASHIRRDLVWAIEQLLWPEQTFAPASELLLRLAIAENETWANNATGIWIESFQMVLGRTAAGAVIRTQVLRRAATDENADARLLAARAIEAAHRMGNIVRAGMPPNDIPNMPSKEWRPENWQEWAATVAGYLGILEPLLEDPNTDVRLAAVQSLASTLDAVMQLPEQVLESWLPLAQKLQTDIFSHRVLVVKAIDQTLTLWAEQLNNAKGVSIDETSGTITSLSEEYRQELYRRLNLLEDVGNSLRGDDFSSRFRLHVNQSIWNRSLGASVDDVEAVIARNLEPLATEVIANPALLENEWDWLAGNLEWRAAERWFEVLGRSDSERTVAKSLQYICTRIPNAISWRSIYELSHARTYRDEQYIDGLLTQWVESGETPIQITDLLFRAGYSGQRGHLLNQLIDSNTISNLQPFAFGSWGGNIPVEVAYGITEAAVSKLNILQIISFVRMYLLQVPEALSTFRNVALQILLDEQSVRAVSGVKDDWADLAELYAGEAPEPIMAAALKRLTLNEMGRSDALRTVVEQTWGAGNKDQLFTNVIGPALEEGGLNAWRLKRVLSALPLGELSPEMILNWVGTHPDRRAMAAADFVGPPSGRPTDLQAQLLEQFGIYGVGASFARNLLSGTWSGSGVEWVRERMALIPEWLADERPAVRNWGREIQEILEGELKRFQRWEEEERFE